MAFKVAVAGATGNIGSAFIKQFLAAGFAVTVLSRSESAPNLPVDVSVRQVDYNSPDSLTAALKGQDALVSTMGQQALLEQKKLIDAAVAAGVKRFLPSEYGSDTSNPNVRALPVKAHKVEVQEYLREISAKTDLTYTIFLTGPFLDWGIEQDFLLGFAGLRNRRAQVFDGGDVEFSATTLPVIAKGVVGILNHLEETKNRVVFGEEAVLTQNQLLRLAQELTPGEQWTVTQASTKELLGKTYEALAREGMTSKTAVDFIVVSVWGEGMSRKFLRNDNALLGIETLPKDGLKAIIKKTLDSF